MALSPIEDSYLQRLTSSQFPDMPASEPAMPVDAAALDAPSMDGMQLAAGPSQTVSDAGAGRGSYAGFDPRLDMANKGQQDQMRAYDPTTRERIASFLQAGFEGLGMDRYKARQNAQTLIGGGSSNLPLDMGLADIVPFLGTALQTEEAVNMGGEAVQSAKQGNYGTAALQAGGAVLGLVPGAAGTVKAAKGLKNLPVGMSTQAVGGMDGVLTPPGPGVVSTRLPTAVKATEDPLASKLVIDLEASKRDPEAFAHNVNLVKQYPNLATKGRTTERVAEDFIGQVKDNLLFLHDQVPEATRQRSKLWYDGARNIADRFAADYGVPDQAVSGVLAVLSPQKDWFMNVSLGQRVLDIATKQKTTRWDSSMDEMAKIIWSKPQYAPMLDAIRGKSLAELNDPGLKAMWLRTYDQAKNPREHQIVSPEGDFVGLRMNQDGKTPTKTGWGSLNEIGKAIVILEDPSIATISSNLGQQHKVRNFYNNIYAPQDPAGHVTIDTHAVAAGLLRPLSGNSREVLHNFGSGVVGEGGPKNSSVTGVQGTYGLYAEAYRRAAQERGILPREMQSITWEAVRGLFPDTFKSQAKNVSEVDGIWLKYKQGKLSLDEARNEVIRTAGGINAPEWERAGLRLESAPEIQPSVNTGELSGTGIPARSAGGSGGVQPAAGSSPSVKEAIPENEFISRDQFKAYANQPNSLKGFRKNGPSKSFDEQSYKHIEFVEIKLDDGSVFLDAIRGLNRTHALSRAFGNWPAAGEIKLVPRAEVAKSDPNLIKEVDAAMAVKEQK